MKVVNAEVLNDIQTGFKTNFNDAFAGYKPYWDGVAMKVPSTHKTEKYPWLGQTSKFKKWIGPRNVQNLEVHGFSITNDSYEDTFAVDREDIEDDAVGVYAPMASQLGYDSAAHPDELIFGLLATGASTPCYDGQYFFDTDHPVRDQNGVTQSVANFTSGAGRLWMLIDGSRPIKPVIYQVRKDYQFVALDRPEDQNVFMNKQFLYGADGRCAVGFGLWQLAYGSTDTITAANVALYMAAMSKFTNDAGVPLGIKATTLVCSTLDEMAAKEAVIAQRNMYGADNVMAGSVTIKAVPWL